MSELKITKTGYVKEFDVELDGSELSGVISNRTNSGKFEYKPDEFEGFLRASDLRAVADMLDKLNALDKKAGVNDEGV